MIVSVIRPLIFTLTLAHLSYHQITLAQAPSKELTFCLNQPTTSSTVQTFWHEAASNCELDPMRLIDLYTQLNARGGVGGDRCTLLLAHQTRKKLIDVVSQQLEGAFITQSLPDNRELNRLLEEIHDTDRRISEAVWQRALEEIHLFVDKEEMVGQILQLKSNEIQVFGLQALLSKSLASLQENQRILPLLTYALTTLLKSKSLPATTLDHLSMFYQQLPQPLLVLYSQLLKVTSVGLLNRAHWEYLYAPRDNGPDGDRRLPLTWSQDKNATDTDGHFVVGFNAAGLVAFGSSFGSTTKFLYADTEYQAPYFWIGPGTKASLQWWQVIWPHGSLSKDGGRAMAFQNNKTREFLCATAPYDENRRYVTLMSGADSAYREDCQWLVKGF